MSSSSLLFCFFILCVSMLVPICIHGSICLPKTHAALFIFGDSLYDSGNNNYIHTTAQNQANFSPYGETFFKYPSGRFTDGRVIPDFIAEFAKLPWILPYLHPGYDSFINGVNFASGGAGALVETHKGFVIDLHTQLDHFRNVSNVLKQHLGESESRHLLSKGVYLISIGSNDYSTIAAIHSTVNHSSSEYVDMVIGNLTTVIKEIYKIGGRKFGVLSLGALGCVPNVKPAVYGSADGCVDAISALARLHNNALSTMLKNLHKQLLGFKYSLTDFYAISSDLIHNPLKYGFKESKVACCGSGAYRGQYSCGGKRGIKEYELCNNVGDYVFFDSTHPTEKAYQIVAKLMWNGNGKITTPYNIKKFFSH